MPEVCMTRERVLCTTNAMDTVELAEHLAIFHQKRKQDGVIFVGSKGHGHLLNLLTQLAPTMFTSEFPVFMPLDYAEDVNLRLDSNIVFYEHTSSTNYGLFDVFAVKKGPLIKLDVGTWIKSNGFIFENSMNRWDRRNDLKGVTFTNNYNVGAVGLLQDLLSCITEKVNMTVRATQLPHEPWEMLANGSWTGGMGVLQRQEADIVSAGLGVGITGQRCSVIDCTLPIIRDPLTLVAAKPKGTNIHPWVYVQVFGVIQWTIFFALLSAFVMIPLLFHTLGEVSEQSMLSVTLKSMETAYLFMIQLGDHENGKNLGMRLLTLTMSMLTLLMFVHYANDITAKMTSGAPKIPVKTFDDVIHYGYKVIVKSSYYKGVLAEAKSGTAKHQVYKKYIENERIRDEPFEAEREIISDPKTLWYIIKLATVPLTATGKELLDQVVALKMDDSSYAISGFGLQKESEFLKMFNHYLLKESEHGIFKRLYRKYNIELYVREDFGMTEPQPLGVDNVVFTFACLGVGVATAMGIAMVESVLKKRVHCQRPCTVSNKYRHQVS